MPVSGISDNQLVFTPVPNANGAAYARFGFQVQDNGGVANGGRDTDPTPKTMTINVAAVNDPPSGTSKTIQVNTGATRTIVAGDFGFSDANDIPNQNVLNAVLVNSLPAQGTLTIVGGPNAGPVTAGTFVQASDINANRLVYTAPTTATSLDLPLSFQVKDDGGTASSGVDLSATATLTIHVNSVAQVNHAPTTGPSTVGGLEDVAYQFKISDFPFTDSALDNPANNLQAVKVASLPGAGTLRNNGNPVSLNQFISFTDIATGKFTYTGPANQFANALTTFTFQVQDDGGTAVAGSVDISTAATMTVNVAIRQRRPAGADGPISVQASGGNAVYTFARPISASPIPMTAPTGTARPIRSRLSSSVQHRARAP